MGLFNKLLGKSGDNKPENELAVQSTRHEIAPSIISRAIAEREYGLSKAIRIPFTEAALTGGSLMQLAPTLKALVAGNQIGNGSLVRVVFPAGVKGNLAIDKAGIMMEINKKLDNIQEMQQRILGFLEQDKQAEQQANLKVLTDILEGYKHNWDNAQYLQNHHMKVLDIKQVAEKNIIFYQEQIAAAIKKMPAIHLDQAVKAAITELGKLFSQYHMALYQFSFASFLEVILLGNFKQAYLDQVAAKVQEYNQHYQIQFSECRDMIKRYSSESVETKVLAGIGNAGKALGKFIGSVPFLSQGPVDEWLLDNGEALLKGNDEKAQKVAALFSAEEKIGSEVFEDSIRKVAVISNQTMDVLFDGEALYLAVA